MRYGIENLLMSHYEFVGYPEKGYQVCYPSDHKEFVVRGEYLLERIRCFKRNSGSKMSLEEFKIHKTNQRHRRKLEKIRKSCGSYSRT